MTFRQWLYLNSGMSKELSALNWILIQDPLAGPDETAPYEAWQDRLRLLGSPPGDLVFDCLAGAWARYHEYLRTPARWAGEKA